MSSENPPSIAPKRPAVSPQRTSTPVGRVSVGTTSPAVPVNVPVDAPVGEVQGRGRSLGDRVRSVTGTASPRDDRDGTPRPERPASSSPAPEAGPRRVRLAVSKVDPWSAMKLSFLLSVAIGIMIVVASVVIWQTLNKMGVFTKINGIIATLAGTPDYFNVLNYAAFPRVVSLATMIAVIDVVLLTALSTIMAFVYNIVSALVGGLHLTLTDD
jgi:hypothetical protein